MMGIKVMYNIKISTLQPILFRVLWMEQFSRKYPIWLRWQYSGLAKFRLNLCATLWPDAFVCKKPPSSRLKTESIYLVSFGVCVHISHVMSSEDGRLDRSSTDLATIRSNQILARIELNHSNRLKSEVLHFRWTSSKIQFPKLSVILVDHYLPLVSAPPQP